MKLLYLYQLRTVEDCPSCFSCDVLFLASISDPACEVHVFSFFLCRWLWNKRVSVVESGDLILGSFNLEIMRTKVYYGYIRCI